MCKVLSTGSAPTHSLIQLGDLLSTYYVPDLVSRIGAAIESNISTISALKEPQGLRGTEMSK